MSAVTIMGRGDDWKECQFINGDLWGTATCLLTPELCDKPYAKVFAFDGLNFPEIEKSVGIARERKIPVVSTLKFADELYPLREIAKEFQSSYFMNSISYMLAYAIYLKYDKIMVWGIGGRKRWDYEMGKNFILFWLGVATGRGIEWRLGQGSARWLYDRKNDMYRPAPEEIKEWHK